MKILHHELFQLTAENIFFLHTSHPNITRLAIITHINFFGFWLFFLKNYLLKSDLLDSTEWMSCGQFPALATTPIFLY